MTLPSDLIAFAVALVGSLLLTVPVRRLALHYGMVDLPGPRKVHLSPIPLLGGIAIYLGFVLAILFTLHGVPHQQMVAILAGGILWGVSGMILFIPFAGILKIISDDIPGWKPLNILLDRDGMK